MRISTKITFSNEPPLKRALDPVQFFAPRQWYFSVVLYTVLTPAYIVSIPPRKSLELETGRALKQPQPQAGAPTAAVT